VDFPITRALIDKLPAWVQDFADRLPQPVKVPLDKGGFRWEHTAKDAETLQVAKAVRVASGLRAAMALADLRYTVECGTLLRTVADFASEIIFLGEGMLEARFTTEQAEFIAQHYSALPSTPDELAAQEQVRYVGRKAMAKATDRIADKTGTDKELLKRISAYLNKGYDGFVHGHYSSAMELFTGRTMTFMMTGHESDGHVCHSKVAVAGKLKEALNAFRFMAITRRIGILDQTFRGAFDALDRSREDAGLPCKGLI
jgi:hypothetical protein